MSHSEKETEERRIKLRGKRPSGVIGEMKPEKLLRMLDKWQEEERTCKELDRLDILCDGTHFDPITRTVTQDAAHIWADARRRGEPFTADDRLDGDAILIAQVRALGNPRQITVITENVRHLEPYVSAQRWKDVEP